MTCFISTINTLVLWFQMEAKDDRLVFCFPMTCNELKKTQDIKQGNRRLPLEWKVFIFMLLA